VSKKPKASEHIAMLREFAGDEVADDAIDEFEIDPVIEQLQAQLTEARAVLALIQYSGSAHACPMCDSFPKDDKDHSYYWGADGPTGLIEGHAADCRLAKCLGDGT
jgi:hypothetical protein